MKQKQLNSLPAMILKPVFFFLLLSAGLGLANLNAQDSKQQKEIGKEASVKKMIDSQRFFFVAQSVMPMSGHPRQLTSEYGIILKKDSLEAFLPYFGRAYTAPVGSMEGGIKFKSFKFDYSVMETKKERWEISLQPKDVDDSYRLNLSISKSGYASLDVTSNSRQPISFQGYIREINSAKGGR